MNLNNYAIYNILSGQIIQICAAESIESLSHLITPEQNVLLMPNYVTDTTYYVENDTYVAIPAKPGPYYIFDYTTKTWVQDYNLASTAVIRRRNEQLYASDWTQIPNNPLTPEKQQEWAVYRQELRDVTLQPGYPFNVVWPTQPSS